MSATQRPEMEDITPILEVEKDEEEKDIEMEKEKIELEKARYRQFLYEQEQKKKIEIEERYKKIKKKKNEQYIEEEHLIQQLSKAKCKKEDFNTILKMIQISLSKTNGLLPIELLQILSCYFKIDIKYINQINESITDIKELSSGVQGIVYTASFNKISNAIVIKSPKSEHLNDEVFHEYFVGIFVTNRMRNYVPNFVWTYGYIKCLPLLGKNKKEGKWCERSENEKDVNFIIYERVDGENLVTAIKNNLDIRYFVSYLLQLLPSLEFASKIFGFTHYDLHAANLLLRNIKSDFVYIKYEKFYVKADKIATMIDFGRATVKVNDKYYGIPGFERFNHYPDKTNPMYDMFKLIGSSMIYAKDYKNTNIYNFCLLIIKDFFKLSDEDIIFQLNNKWIYAGNDDLGKLFNYIVYNDKFSNIIKEILFLNIDDQKKVLCMDELCLRKL